MKPKLIAFTSAFALIAALVLFSCQKSNQQSIEDNREELLFKNESKKKMSDFVIGGNIEKVTRIGYDNSVLSSVKSSPEWKALTAKNNILVKDIKRSYLYSGGISLVTIPLAADRGSNQYLNVYIQGEKFLITKLTETKQESGLTTYKILSSSDELFYQFDLNDKNQIGNWKFVKDLPKIFAREAVLVPEEPGGGGCSSKPFYECMNCLIVGVCGSDWLCTIACGLAIPSCLGGAAAVCLLA
ncbi:hypothetical protein [Terrimonas ferruginea]|uniref:hypothetical protein n=1 Tax=Terrimonas ferruginea TaxID=249 RepID=UPI0004191710|nr:hypothetical protein [Terrimonas ferruginea]